MEPWFLGSFLARTGASKAAQPRATAIYARLARPDRDVRGEGRLPDGRHYERDSDEAKEDEQVVYFLFERQFFHHNVKGERAALPLPPRRRRELTLFLHPSQTFFTASPQSLLLTRRKTVFQHLLALDGIRQELQIHHALLIRLERRGQFPFLRHGFSPFR